MNIKLHNEISESYVNGPTQTGRYVVWVQHCPFACKGCFNPETWSKDGGYVDSVNTLVSRILDSTCDGVTISGGEPFMQRFALLALLRSLDANRDKLPYGIISYSGFKYTQIKNMDVGKEILSYLDVLIDGLYVDEDPAFISQSGSANQSFHYNPKPGYGRDVLSQSDIEQIDNQLEVHVRDNGNIAVTGFPHIDKSFLKQMGLTVIDPNKDAK